MPCRPGFVPVKADVQAQSVIGGQTDLNGARNPRLTRSSRTGRSPSAKRGSATSQEAESQPRMTSRGAKPRRRRGAATLPPGRARDRNRSGRTATRPTGFAPANGNGCAEGEGHAKGRPQTHSAGRSGALVCPADGEDRGPDGSATRSPPRLGPGSAPGRSGRSGDRQRCRGEPGDSRGPGGVVTSTPPRSQS